MPKDLRKLPLNELRQMWAQAWSQEPHMRIGRTMLEKSLEYKIREREGGGPSPEQQPRLKQLVREYKRNPISFDGNGPLKPGTRLMRMHNGKKYTVLVKIDGFEYNDQTYSSLSKIANDITGKRWNGWVFFGLKKVAHEKDLRDLYQEVDR
jgi:hypothetical protein